MSGTPSESAAHTPEGSQQHFPPRTPEGSETLAGGQAQRRPPVQGRTKAIHPEGIAEFTVLPHILCDPSRVGGAWGGRFSGGLAALDHRLMSWTPSESSFGVLSPGIIPNTSDHIPRRLP